MENKFFALCLVVLVAGCNGRNVGVDGDAGADAGTSSRVIEYTLHYPERNEIEIGRQNVPLVEVRMKNLHDSEQAMISDLVLRMMRSPWWNVRNHRLYLNSELFSGVEFSNEPGSLDLWLEFISQPAINPGEAINFLITGDVWDGACFNFNIDLEEDDTYVLGGTTDSEFELRRSLESEEVPQRLGVGNILILGGGPDQIPEQYIPAGAANVPVVNFVLQAGVPATLEDFQVEVRYAPNMGEYISDLIVIHNTGNGGHVISGPVSIPTNCPEPDRCFYTFGDSFDLESCAADSFDIALTFSGDAPEGDIVASLHAITFDAINRSTLDPLPIPTSNVTGHPQHVVSPGL